MKKAFVLVFVLDIVFCFAGLAGDVLRITGSASVYPVIAFISENALPKNKLIFGNPIIESVGTGAGFDAFCKAKFSSNSPDIINASRPITPQEELNCVKNGLPDLSRITLGLDGIIIAFSSEDNIFEGLDLRIEDLFNAFSRSIVSNGKVVRNTVEMWNDVRSDLPKIPILLYGPPSTSGTYDFFTEMLQKHCLSLPAMKEHFGDKAKQECRMIRAGETYSAVMDQDSTIARKLELQEGSLGILRFPFFIHSGRFSATKIDGIEPTEKTITSKTYEFARPLYVYFSRSSIKKVKGMKAFLTEIAHFSYRNLYNSHFRKIEESSNFALVYSGNKAECQKIGMVIGKDLLCQNQKRNK